MTLRKNSITTPVKGKNKTVEKQLKGIAFKLIETESNINLFRILL